MFKSALSREALEQAMQPVDGLYPSLQAIGQPVGLTRERVRQRLIAEGLQKLRAPRAAPGTPRCLKCHRAVKRTLKGVPYRCTKCFPQIHFVYVYCGECQQRFLIRLCDLRVRLHITGNKKGTPRTTPLFCSQRCHGMWAARHYGFLAHPWSYSHTYEGSVGDDKEGPGQTSVLGGWKAGTVNKHGGYTVPGAKG